MSLIGEMSKDLKISESYLNLLEKKNNSYRKITINGKKKKRIVYVPSKELKTVQYWLVHHIFNKCKTSEYCTAYKQGMSIKNNAEKHSKNNYILHMDIKNFFPSVNNKKLITALINNDLNLSKKDIVTICRYSLYQSRYLVIGSVCAPIIANIIMYDFDKELANMLKKSGNYTYTRYSDDIIVSSKDYIDEGIVDTIEGLLNKYGFEVNKKKTHFMSRNMKRNVTGISIDNNTNKLSIGTKNYRDIKKCLYEYLVKNNGNREYILGYLSYVKDVNKSQYAQLVKIYKKYDKKGKIFNS